MATKNGFDITKLIFRIMCVTVVQWWRIACTCRYTVDSRRSVSLYRFLFFCLVFVFKYHFFFWPVLLYSYCWPCWSCTWINIYFKLKSGVLFWKRDFKRSWSAYWQSVRPEKNITCQDMPLFWNSWILVGIMTKSTQYTTNCSSLHPTRTSYPLAN